MRAGIFSSATPLKEALEQVCSSLQMVGADLASEVTCANPYHFESIALNPAWYPAGNSCGGLRVAVLDFGVKLNILRKLACHSCDVTVLPAKSSAEEILTGEYDGLLVSNGPGDPAAVTYGIKTVRQLIGKIPIFGICLGHQLLSLAAGMETFKLPFGHRGANHPVRREADQIIEITSQNHGFAVRPEGLGQEWRITHINLNDHTVEGLEHIELPIFSIQYHPEASPGPHDSLNYFDRFIREMRHAEE
jgi:carbamoyl-phosphate synthase small subunit